ncbi:MAG: hypothetical protein ACPGYT_06870 [Nitrospirales bacterium]
MTVQQNFIFTLMTLLLLVVAPPVGASDTNTSNLSVTIANPAHFTIADGSDVVIQPGTYQVEAAEPWLRLIPGERRDALLLDATGIHHEEIISEPAIRLTTEGAESVVQLLLPDGKGLEAVSTESGVRSRAVKRARPAKSITKRKTVIRRPLKKSTKTHSPGKSVQQLDKQVQDLQRLVHTLQNRLTKLESAVHVGNAGITINSSAKIKLNASSVEVSSSLVTVNSGQSKFNGVIQADTVITNSVVSSSYTPGAGNIW